MNDARAEINARRRALYAEAMGPQLAQRRREFLSLHDSLMDAAATSEFRLADLERYSDLESVLRRAGEFPELLILRHMKRRVSRDHRAALAMLAEEPAVRQRVAKTAGWKQSAVALECER